MVNIIYLYLIINNTFEKINMYFLFLVLGERLIFLVLKTSLYYELYYWKTKYCELLNFKKHFSI